MHSTGPLNFIVIFYVFQRKLSEILIIISKRSFRSQRTKRIVRDRNKKGSRSVTCYHDDQTDNVTGECSNRRTFDPIRIIIVIGLSGHD